MTTALQPPLLPPPPVIERALAAKDPAYDGLFFVAVKTTGIFCRPSCPSRPRPENTECFATAGQCVEAGYRPCLRCRPLEASGAPPAWVAHLMARVLADPQTPVRSSDLAQLGISAERARRWFLENYGLSFSAWCRTQRLNAARAQLRAGGSIDDATFQSGYGSHSGFREAFTRAFGTTPGKAAENRDAVVVRLIESPLGPLFAGATDTGLCLLDFTDQEPPRERIARAARRLGAPLVHGDHPLLERAARQLDQYFRKERREFDLPLDPRGTTFQLRVWEELRRIPYGGTLAYDDLARRIGRPTAQRAVAQANGSNSVAIVIPCHRVIGKDGSLTGYGGGVWRKRLLLELEKSPTP